MIATETSPPPAPALAPPRPVGWYLPWVAVAFVGLYLLSVIGRMSPPKEPYNLDLLARIPVVQSGRVKPLDTVARVYLRMISGREEFEDDKGNKHPAIEWYLDVIGGAGANGFPDKTSALWRLKVFRVDNEQLLGEMKLTVREGLRYSLEEMAPQLTSLFAKAASLKEKQKEGKKPDLGEAKALDLAERIQLVLNLCASRGIDAHGNKLLLLPPQHDGEEWKSLGEFREEVRRNALSQATQAAQEHLLADPQRLDHLTPDDEQALIRAMFETDPEKMPPEKRATAIKRIAGLLRENPRTLSEEGREVWLDLVLELLPAPVRNEITTRQKQTIEAGLATEPAAETWGRIAAAYREKKPQEFDSQLKVYRDEYLHHVSAAELSRTHLEVAYNRFAPFYQCTGLYILVFLMTIGGFVLHVAELPKWGSAVRASATRVLLFTLIIHTVSLVVRMDLMDRWFVFVTNLYSSAIFIGWGCVVIGLVLEKLYPLGIGNIIASVLGVLTTIVAHNLATDDTIEMMQAVLDTNFWLAIHVTTVTLGYTATFVAGFLGTIYVWQLLATVIRDSFANPKPPTSGELLAFGVAAIGLPTIPLLFVWFLHTALIKFEILHPGIVVLLFYLLAAAGVVYALALLFSRAIVDVVDAHGQPTPTPVPWFARPLTRAALTPERPAQDPKLVGNALGAGAVLGAPAPVAVWGRVLGQMIYGVLCFATLLSFFGTVSGGIWADQSWGRFWGWDPKENGAVLIVLWNTLILHARWAGLVKIRGMAVMVAVGNMITAWSWFGTNQLGVGLHAYGFDTRLADGCTNFWISQLVIIGLGLIPQKYWASATRPVRTTPVSSHGADPSTAPNANGHAGKGKKTARRR